MPVLSLPKESAKGRFLSIDPMADYGGQQVVSPYHAMNCNPVTTVDPLGLQGFHMNRSIGQPTMTPFWASYYTGGDHGAPEFQRQLDERVAIAELWASYMGQGLQGEVAQEGFRTLVAANGALPFGGNITFGMMGYDPEIGYDFKTYLTVSLFAEPVRSAQTNPHDSRQDKKNKDFWLDNWKDVAFMGNDIAQSLTNSSSLNAALRMGRNSTMVFTLGRAIPMSTKIVNGVAKIGAPIAKAAPYLAVGTVAYNVIDNGQITAGDVYQVVITGLSVIPGWGLAIGGISLLAEGISYYYTGQSISDNINESMNGGVIKKWE